MHRGAQTSSTIKGHSWEQFNYGVLLAQTLPWWGRKELLNQPEPSLLLLQPSSCRRAAPLGSQAHPWGILIPGHPPAPTNLAFHLGGSHQLHCHISPRNAAPAHQRWRQTAAREQIRLRFGCRGQFLFPNS